MQTSSILAPATGLGYSFHPTILREYDIRGVVGETLGEEDARALGRAFGTVLRRRGGRSVAVAYDGRLSSQALEQALVDGLAAAGVDVMRIGLGPTPMLYFAAYTQGVDGGIMVTGSHNPPDYNGFKLVIDKKPFYGDDITALGRMAAAGDFESGAGTVTQRSLQAAYIARLVQDYTGGRPLRVAWDAGNGAAGDALTALARDLPGDHILLNEKIDGTFPAHHPDPTVPENLVQLQETVRSRGCDFGIAFDGDGDRLGIVDGQGRILWGDQIMVLLARDVLSRNPGATVIADVKASQVLFDEIAKAGGRPLMWKTGHALIKSKMAEEGAALAGEMSAHIFFADGYYGYDDALYGAVRLINIIANGTESLAEFRDSLPAVLNTPEIRVTCAEERKAPIVAEVTARLISEGTEYNDIDGLRVDSADGWWLVRASNTQNALVVRCESQDQDGLDRLKQTVARHLAASGLENPF